MWGCVLLLLQDPRDADDAIKALDGFEGWVGDMWLHGPAAQQQLAADIVCAHLLFGDEVYMLSGPALQPLQEHMQCGALWPGQLLLRGCLAAVPCLLLQRVELSRGPRGGGPPPPVRRYEEPPPPAYRRRRWAQAQQHSNTAACRLPSAPAASTRQQSLACEKHRRVVLHPLPLGTECACCCGAHERAPAAD